MPEWLDARVPGLVNWAGWEAIDAHERSLGEPVGRPRVKLVRTEQLMQVGRATAADEIEPMYV